jgi:hypothetical protein
MLPEKDATDVFNGNTIHTIAGRLSSGYSNGGNGCSPYYAVFTCSKPAGVDYSPL